MLRRVALATLLGFGAAAPAARAQGVVITGTTVIDYADLQPLVLDSVPEMATSDTGLLRRATNGAIVECLGVDAYCTYMHSAPVVSTLPIFQDLTASAWGLGMGLSVYADVRLSVAAGEAADIWPQANQTFQLVTAYAELDRDDFRVRLGRQWVSSALGYYNFDGGDVLVRPVHTLSIELQGGWSLEPGLNAPVTSTAISDAEPLASTVGAYVFAGQLRFDPNPHAAFDIEYLRELATDASGLFSERMAAGAQFRFPGVDIGSGMQYDIASGTFDDIHVDANVPLPDRFHLDAEVRHYVPYFDMWTIWGVFDPVGYTEARLGTTWATVDDRWSFGLRGGYRRYADAETGVVALPLVSDGWNADATASWRLATRWSLHGEYQFDFGSGASLSDASVSLRWSPTTRTTFDLLGSSSQSLYEFEIGSGEVLGLGLNTGITLTSKLHVIANAALYHQVGMDTPQVANWNQRRASVELQWTLGRDAGLRGSWAQ